MARPLLARDRVRFVGEPVAAVVAETAAGPRTPPSSSWSTSTRCRPWSTPRRRWRSEHLLFPEAGTNAGGGRRRRYRGGGPGGLRGRGARPTLAQPARWRRARSRRGWRRRVWTDDGRLVHWRRARASHPIAAALCRALRAGARRRCAVITPRRGRQLRRQGPGLPRGAAAAVAGARGSGVRCGGSRRGRPTWWASATHGPRSRRHDRRRSGRHDAGRSRCTSSADCGAYPVAAPMLARNTGHAAARRVPHRDGPTWTVTAVVTNTTPIAAYRGAGRPEAAAAHRARGRPVRGASSASTPSRCAGATCCAPDDFPWTRRRPGLTYDSGDYQRGSRRGPRRRRLRRAAGRAGAAGGTPAIRRCSASAWPPSSTAPPGSPAPSTARSSCAPTACCWCAPARRPYGQGHHTAWAMLVSDRTGVPLDRIEVVHGDTDVVPRGGITGGSRSVQKAGSAVAGPPTTLVERGQRASPPSCSRRPSTTSCSTPAPAALPRGGHAGRARSAGPTWPPAAVDDARRRRCAARTTSTAATPTFPFGAYVAVVEVDAETGQVTLRAHGDRRRRRTDPQPAAGPGPGARRRRPGHRARRCTRSSSTTPTATPSPPTSPTTPSPPPPSCPRFEATLVETPVAQQRAGRQGHRRVGHHRRATGRPERGGRRPGAPRRPPPRHAAHSPAGVGDDQRRSQLTQALRPWGAGRQDWMTAPAALGLTAGAVVAPRLREAVSGR